MASKGSAKDSRVAESSPSRGAPKAGTSERLSRQGERLPAVGIAGVLESDDVRDILRAQFFAPVDDDLLDEAEAPRDPQGDRESGLLPTAPVRKQPESKGVASKKAAKPEHYKVICISLYNEDLARLDALVESLKSRGFTKANRSAVLRAAIEQFEPRKVKRGL
ncbi:MAG: hypothetical protein Q8Q09_25100 [Deltaproteobacteria bacterium]|nr:hypothetical protein [Deltaproteobacteria bacterium]